ncbi:hypothetical protein Q5752_006003 [Cryptotrichosporon argae]
MYMLVTATLWSTLSLHNKSSKKWLDSVAAAALADDKHLLDLECAHRLRLLLAHIERSEVVDGWFWTNRSGHNVFHDLRKELKDDFMTNVALLVVPFYNIHSHMWYEKIDRIPPAHYVL